CKGALAPLPERGARGEAAPFPFISAQIVGNRMGHAPLGLYYFPYFLSLKKT
ncbi:MAG: hypothetical protein K0S07_1718, partial [Chlamydiales bacterium]|nr:hypothetical protein [Chlamydiales bacterium]